jgi:hypothetical protein
MIAGGRFHPNRLMQSSTLAGCETKNVPLAYGSGVYSLFWPNGLFVNAGCKMRLLMIGWEFFHKKIFRSSQPNTSRELT